MYFQRPRAGGRFIVVEHKPADLQAVFVPEDALSEYERRGRLFKSRLILNIVLQQEMCNPDQMGVYGGIQ